MNETAQIKYLITLLGIAGEVNELVIADMTNELRQLKDSGAFAFYCKNNFSRHQFWNGYQKFLILLGEYKELELEAFFKVANREKIKQIEASAIKLVDKIKASDEIRTQAASWSLERYFTPEEIAIIPYPIESYMHNLDSLCKTIVHREVEKLREELKPKEISFNFQYLGAQK
jgi:hypothetical protein